MFNKFNIGLRFLSAEGTAAGAGQSVSGAAGGSAAVGVAQPTRVPTREQSERAGLPVEENAETATGETAKYGNPQKAQALSGEPRHGVATVPEGETAGEEGDDQTKAVDPAREFEGLIGKNGKYNKQFTAKVDEILRKRFGQSEGMKAEISSLTGKVEEYERGLAPLYQLYGVATVQDLYDKISENSSFWEDEADRRGITAEELRSQIKRDMEVAELRRENEKLKSAETDRVNEAKRRAQYDVWDAQVKKLRETVPDFDMQSEMENNRDFAKLIRAGIGIDMAYNMTHMEDQISRAKEDGKKAAAAEIAQRKARPRENAAAYAGGASLGPRMPATAEERAAIARRAATETDIDFKTKF